MQNLDGEGLNSNSNSNFPIQTPMTLDVGTNRSSYFYYQTPTFMSEGHDFDPTTIPGNATIQTKLAVSKWISVWQQDKSYGDNIGSRVRLTEISIDHKSHQPEKLEGKVVAEIRVTEGTPSRVSVGGV